MAPGDLALSCKSDLVENHTGFSAQVLVDLQKVLCCLQIVQAENGGKPISNAQRAHFKLAAASFDYSSRITLAQRQSTVWKCLGLT